MSTYRVFPPVVSFEEEDEWGIAAALHRDELVVLDPPADSVPLPGGVWPEPVTQVAVLPLPRSAAAPTVRGSLLVGVNSRLRLNAAYVAFLRLIAGQVASAVSAVQLMERERAARNEAELAARLRDEFLATLSHELRTPLNAVIGWTHILKADLANPTRAATAVEVIQRNAEMQARLISDLLDVSRIMSGNMPLNRQPDALGTVIAAGVASVEPVATAKEIRIECRSEAPDATVDGDPARIQQMLWNLLTNAIKFTPPGGRVRVSLALEASRAEMRVTDDGEGIAPEFLPFLFDRFRQADGSRSRRHGGMGLGLSIVKQLAELHGGDVRAISGGSGRGATFVLVLPAVTDPKHLAQVADVSLAVPPLTDDRPLSGVRVLVVDDQPDALAMLRRLLEDYGAVVFAASSAETALTLAINDPYDVIVSDIAMPGLDGYAFIRELRRHRIDTPALALTALALADDRARVLSAGYQAYLSKPINPAEVLAAVAALARKGVAP